MNKKALQNSENAKNPYNPDSEKLTVFIEMDDTFLHVFYPDAHEGYLNQPLRDFDHYLEFPEYDTYLNVYKRHNFDKFLDYLRSETQAVVFSTGSKVYVDKILDLFDPDYEVFKLRLNQEDCDLVEYEKEEINEFVKDLDWIGADLNRSVLIDRSRSVFGVTRITRFRSSLTMDMLWRIKSWKF